MASLPRPSGPEPSLLLRDLAQGKRCRTYSWERRTWGWLSEANVNIQLGMVCPHQVTAVLTSHSGEGEESQGHLPLFGASAFQIRLELEVKRKGLNWMRDLTTVWSSLHLNTLTRHLNILTRLLDARRHIIILIFQRWKVTES